ncbi:peptidoglycan/xylan/chitin deacetylase (PgdA/CDA1 family) [Desulfobaculum xiamenense]|uniref:Peptidoglycan/xylan/chitin deacetylase (PgdA/CDA1 family) n=1 Tax=Desulfobaculum xiamenense TaxID=995050 RepID=A0A846QPS3_9BACT|nr:polysaccharide deacetylase family protein [Desulfobaculum xiamenense]NJB67214.1 peptidoglycan/xylan/chitin deacetylase (PgdA/CDA1 family) [Desulfobaculum xiamenense]
MLHALWDDAQLAGSEGDLRRVALDQPDLTPPLRTQPLRVLPPVPSVQQHVIRRVEPVDGRKVVALTFDLCERAVHRTGYQKDVVNFLRASGVKATFFAGGKWMRSHPEKTMQLMADSLFELGNHAWTHGNLAIMDEAEVRQQMDWTQAQYELLYEALQTRADAQGLSDEFCHVPASIRVMRLPYGRGDVRTGAILAAMGLPMIQWSVTGEYDERERTIEQLVAWNLEQIRPGAIVLMHANTVPQKTNDLVRRLVPELRRRGYEFVTVSELLALGTAVTVTDGYFEHPGDNLDLDGLFEGKGTLGRAK